MLYDQIQRKGKSTESCESSGGGSRDSVDGGGGSVMEQYFQ